MRVPRSCLVAIVVIVGGKTHLLWKRPAKIYIPRIAVSKAFDAASSVLWVQALTLAAENFTAHYELAGLAEQRDDLTLAAEHYRRAWEILQSRKQTLLDLGRVWKAMNRDEDANAAVVAWHVGGGQVLLQAQVGAFPRLFDQIVVVLLPCFSLDYGYMCNMCLNDRSRPRRRTSGLAPVFKSRLKHVRQYNDLVKRYSASGDAPQAFRGASIMAAMIIHFILFSLCDGHACICAVMPTSFGG